MPGPTDPEPGRVVEVPFHDVAGVALWGSQGDDDPKRQVEVTRTFLA